MARSVIFRFYGNLNDFLPLDRRQRAVCYEFSGTPAVKDAVEALGVPHPEIDLIVVSGVLAGFDHRLCPGDRVAVYPAFRNLDLGSVPRLQPGPPRRWAFILDVHLGKLARRLRLLGLDTLYRNDYADREIVRIALLEDRVILTRDRGLLKHSVVRRGLFIRSQEVGEQIGEVLERFDLLGEISPFTRCLVCNGCLEKISRERGLDRLPPRVRREQSRFKICPDCGKVYWPGSHRQAMEAWLTRLLPAYFTTGFVK